MSTPTKPSQRPGEDPLLAHAKTCAVAYRAALAGVHMTAIAGIDARMASLNTLTRCKERFASAVVDFLVDIEPGHSSSKGIGYYRDLLRHLFGLTEKDIEEVMDAIMHTMVVRLSGKKEAVPSASPTDAIASRIAGDIGDITHT